MIHKLKILPQYFETVKEGAKTFEIRKDDRDYKVGDTLILKEYRPLLNIENRFSGEEIKKEISYVLKDCSDYGLEDGYCILGLKEPLRTIGNCARCGRTLTNDEKCDCKIEEFQEGIKLVNIDLTGISKDEQWEKICEEESEFVEAYLDYENSKTEENKKHLIEELLDTFQSALGALQLEGIPAQNIMDYYPIWQKKLADRPRKKKSEGKQ